MVLDTKSVPTGIPNLGCDEEGALLGANCDIAGLWGSCRARLLTGSTALLCSLLVCSAPCWSALLLLWSAPFCATLLWPALVYSALLCSGVTSLVFQLSQGNTVFSHGWKGKVCSQSQRTADLYGQKSLPLVPDWSVLMQTRIPNPHSLAQKALLNGQSRTTGWVELYSFSWMGEASVLLDEIKFQELFFKGWFRWQKLSAGR